MITRFLGNTIGCLGLLFLTGLVLMLFGGMFSLAGRGDVTGAMIVFVLTVVIPVGVFAWGIWAGVFDGKAEHKVTKKTRKVPR